MVREHVAAMDDSLISLLYAWEQIVLLSQRFPKLTSEPVLLFYTIKSHQRKFI